MRRTRRSGSTAGEALPLQLHIAGPQKGVGPFSRGRALVAGAGSRASRCSHRVDSCRPDLSTAEPLLRPPGITPPAKVDSLAGLATLARRKGRCSIPSVSAVAKRLGWRLLRPDMELVTSQPPQGPVAI
jgi:hypothetical protein